MRSQSVCVARWVRPAISILRTSYSGGLGQEWEYDCMLFLGEALLCDNVLCWFFSGLSYVTSVVSFFQKSNCFWFGFAFATFLCFVISFLDFIIVFKRIIYPVLSWDNPVWVPLVFIS